MAVSAIAGNYPGGIKQTCILDEGAPTVQTLAMDSAGTYQTIHTWAAGLREGDIVALSNDSANTYAATGGLPVVERIQNAEALVFGQIVSSPTLQKVPTATDADTNTLAERLAGKYYRVAVVEVWAGITKIMKATITTTSGANHIIPGVATCVNVDISLCYAAAGEGLQIVPAAANGVGVIPLTYVADGGTTTFSVLLGIIGLMYGVS